MSGHADAFIDMIDQRQKQGIQKTHFVTHSFGGVVLHRAFKQGLAEVLDEGISDTRCVLVAPPLRGAAFARAFQKNNVMGPEMMKNAIHRTAQAILGAKCGMELMMNDEKWFAEETGVIPDQVDVLVVGGKVGNINPLIGDVSDGVVALKETWMNRQHYRMEVGVTHNFLLYTPKVVAGVKKFLRGEEVGKLVGGEEYIMEKEMG